MSITASHKNHKSVETMIQYSDIKIIQISQEVQPSEARIRYTKKVLSRNEGRIHT